MKHTSPASPAPQSLAKVKPFDWFTVPAVTLGDTKPAPVQLLNLPTSEVEDSASRNGSHWFSPGAMRFFRGRVSRDAYRASTSRLAFFVSSEQFVGGNGRAAARAYSVRVCSLDSGKVDTVGKFQGWASGAAATREAQRAAVLSAFVAAGYGTCPTANGRDLEIWEGLAALAAKRAGAETVNA